MLPRVMVIPGSDGEVKDRMEGVLTSQAVVQVQKVKVWSCDDVVGLCSVDGVCGKEMGDGREPE